MLRGGCGSPPRAVPRPRGSERSPPSPARKVKRVLFVPYALHDRDAYARTAREKFESLGKAGPPRAPRPSPLPRGGRAAGAGLAERPPSGGGERRGASSSGAPARLTGSERRSCCGQRWGGGRARTDSDGTERSRERLANFRL